MEISDALVWTEILDYGEPVVKKLVTNKEDFGYKRSPFQGKDNLILRACFKLTPGKKDSLINLMNKKKKERQDKGHYLFPCAGSAFKNNRDFGKPTGIIIDELGLKGFSIGGAQIAPFHGNFVINTGKATAKDIRSLVDEVAAKVKTTTGFNLEPEILFVGEW
jgi:UDP-N-acetylmuramate dehydrogenase